MSQLRHVPARIDAGFYANKCRLGPRVRHN